jgi:hypothetical protein
MVDTLLVMRLLEWFRKAAYKERPQDTGATLIFPVSRPARYFYAVGTLFAAALGVLSFFVEDLEWYIKFAFIPMVALFFTRWPWAVELGPEGISKRSYFGTTKTIHWMDVTALSFNRKTGIFTVIGKDGQKIKCSAFMVSPAQFYLEVYKRATALGPMPTRDFDGLPVGSCLPIG